MGQDLTQVEGRAQELSTSDGQHAIAHAYGAQPTAFNGGALRVAGRAQRLIMSQPRVRTERTRSGSTRTRVDPHSGERGDPVAQPCPPDLLLMGAELCKLYLGHVSELYHFGGAGDPARGCAGGGGCARVRRRGAGGLGGEFRLRRQILRRHHLRHRSGISTHISTHGREPVHGPGGGAVPLGGS